MIASRGRSADGKGGIERAGRRDGPGPSRFDATRVRAWLIGPAAAVLCGGFAALALMESAGGPVLAVARKPEEPAKVELPGRVPESTAPPKVSESVAAEPVGLILPTEPDGPLGYRLFVRDWLPDDPRCHGGDGLGPVYNESSCLACHGQGGPGGSGPASTNVDLIAAVNGSSIGKGVNRTSPGTGGALSAEVRAALASVHPGFGEASSTTLHHRGNSREYSDWRAQLLGYEVGQEPATWPFAIAGCQYGPAEVSPLRPEGVSGIAPPRTRDTASDPVGKPGEEVRPGTGELVRFAPVRLLLSRRNPPPLFGSGAIDAIEEAEIVANGERSHKAFPQVTGRASRARDGRIGRFGRKAQIASLGDFVASACAGELGLEVPGHHQPHSPLTPEATPKGLDMTQAECDALADYIRRLPRPVVEEVDPNVSAEAARGRELLSTIGCVACHTPNLGGAEGIYSDLLVHDMGVFLADDSSYYSTEAGSSSAPATGTEWRTAPLWGLRDSAPYLHDGRARTIEEAVAAHAGEAQPSAVQYAGLGVLDRLRLDGYLLTLVAPPVERPAPPPTAKPVLASEPSQAWVEGSIRNYDEGLKEGLASAKDLHLKLAEGERAGARARLAYEEAQQAAAERRRDDAERLRVEAERSRPDPELQAYYLYQKALVLDGQGNRRLTLEVLRQAASEFPETRWGQRSRLALSNLEAPPTPPQPQKRSHRR